MNSAPTLSAFDPSEAARGSHSWLSQTVLQQPLAGCYQVHGLVGRGGMGFVYEAEHLPSQRRVAVKVAVPALPSGCEHFVREANVLRRLVHPHIVQVLDHGVDGSTPFLVMELLCGETLQSLLQRQGRLPLSEARRILRGLCSALTYAHRAGVVHRDIKPANVFLVTAAGEPAFVKLLDFGVSSSPNSQFPAAEGQWVGTPSYMSPEQIKGDLQVDARSDQFSLAVLAYEMITGKHPFKGGRSQGLFQRITSGDVPAISSTRGVPLPAALDVVFARALSKRAQDRYETIDDFHEALSAASIPTAAYPTEHAGRDSTLVSWRGPSANDPLPMTRGPVTSQPGSVNLTSLLHSLSSVQRALLQGQHHVAKEAAESCLALASSAPNADTEALLGLCRDWLDRALHVAAVSSPTGKTPPVSLRCPMLIVAIIVSLVTTWSAGALLGDAAGLATRARHPTQTSYTH